MKQLLRLAAFLALLLQATALPVSSHDEPDQCRSQQCLSHTTPAQDHCPGGWFTPPRCKTSDSYEHYHACGERVPVGLSTCPSTAQVRHYNLIHLEGSGYHVIWRVDAGGGFQTLPFSSLAEAEAFIRALGRIDFSTVHVSRESCDCWSYPGEDGLHHYEVSKPVTITCDCPERPDTEPYAPDGGTAPGGATPPPTGGTP
jgi:hypothetical protein